MADVTELRAAAERLRAWDSSPNTQAKYDAYRAVRPNGITELNMAHQRDMRAIVNAYLAEHPADDDELIDERWLQSLGCQRREEWQAWVVPNDDQCVTLSRSASYPDLWDLQYETDFQWPNGLRFKRDVRAVLRALLIELTEGPAVR